MAARTGIRGVGVALLLVVALAACGTSVSPTTPAGAPARKLVCASCARASSVGTLHLPRRTAAVHVVLAGDVLLHNGLWATAANDARKDGRPAGVLDFGPLFGPVHRLVAGADLAVCHLETPLAPPGGPFSGYPLFAVPPRIAGGLRQAGFDVCTTASNHSLDQGQSGVRHTLRALDRQGIAHTGTARTPTEQRRPELVEVQGILVAVLSYTYGTNGLVATPGTEWSVNLADPARIRADARRAKERGADVVLVALHWGNEYRHEPSAAQLELARAVTRSRHVDLVYGHHAHVVQPVRRINGTWVIFGLGNLVAQQDPAIVGVYEGIVAQVDLVRRPSGRVAARYVGYRPTYISRFSSSDPATRVIDIERALRRGTFPALRGELVAARDRIAAIMQ